MLLLFGLSVNSYGQMQYSEMAIESSLLLETPSVFPSNELDLHDPANQLRQAMIHHSMDPVLALDKNCHDCFPGIVHPMNLDLPSRIRKYFSGHGAFGLSGRGFAINLSDWEKDRQNGISLEELDGWESSAHQRHIAMKVED